MAAAVEAASSGLTSANSHTTRNNRDSWDTVCKSSRLGFRRSFKKVDAVPKLSQLGFFRSLKKARVIITSTPCLCQRRVHPHPVRSLDESCQGIRAAHSCNLIGGLEKRQSDSGVGVSGARRQPLEQHCKARRGVERGGGIFTDNMRDEEGRIDLEVSTAGSEGEEETYTVEDAISALGFGPFQILMMGYTGLAWIAEAMELMLVSFVGREVAVPWHLSSSQEAGISSAVFAGMMVGAYSWGLLSDMRGRRVGFFVPSFLTFTAGIASAFSPNYWTLLFTRALVGVGLGAAPVIYALFMELVPARTRGLWLVVVSAFWTAGAVGEALLAWAVLPHSELGWRGLVALSAFPLFLLLVLYPILPESPRFHLLKGDRRSALATLRNISRLNKRPLPSGALVHTPPPPPSPSPEHAKLLPETLSPTSHPPLKNPTMPSTLSANPRTITATSARHLSVPRRPASPPAGDLEVDFGEGLLEGRGGGEGKGGLSEGGVLSVFRGLLAPAMRVPTILLWGVFFSSAFTYYGVVLLTSQIAGGAQHGCASIPDHLAPPPVPPPPDNVYRDTLVASLGEIPGLLISALVIDRYGRKVSMTSLFAATGLFLLPLIFLPGEGVTTALLFGARACIMGAFTILYVYAPEVYPTSTRSTGLGIANFFGRVGGLVCPIVAIDLVKSCNQPLAISLFAGISLAAALAVAFFPIETRGRPLIEVVPDNDDTNSTQQKETS